MSSVCSLSPHSFPPALPDPMTYFLLPPLLFSASLKTPPSPSPSYLSVSKSSPPPALQAKSNPPTPPGLNSPPEGHYPRLLVPTSTPGAPQPQIHVPLPLCLPHTASVLYSPEALGTARTQSSNTQSHSHTVEFWIQSARTHARRTHARLLCSRALNSTQTQSSLACS